MQTIYTTKTRILNVALGHMRPTFAYMLASMFLCLAPAQGARAVSEAKTSNLIEELNPTQRSILQDGGQVIITENIAGDVWPRARIYQMISASAEETMAVFFDCESAYTYVPHLTHSVISKKIDARTYEVDYRLNIPIMPDERYTVRSSLHPLQDGRYELDWKLLRATTTRASEGSFRVQLYGENKSIFCYSSLVVPGSRFAIVLRGLALEQLQQTVWALVNQITKQKNQNPEGLQLQITTLRKALSQKTPTSAR